MGNYLIRGGNFFDGGGKIDYNSEQNLNYAQEAFAKGLKDFNSISGSVVNVKDFLNNVKTQTGIDYMSSSEETKPKS